MRWRKSGAAVGLLALALGVAACDPGGEDPTTPPTTDVTTTTDPTTEPTETETSGPPDIDPPEVPDGMDVDDHQGAALAAGYFLELANYMNATGETALFEAMSGPDCNFCSYTVETVTALYEDGGWVEGGELVFDISTADVVLPTAEQPAYTVQLNAEQNAQTTHLGDGSTESAGASQIELALGVQYTGGEFTILGVNVGPR